MESVFNLDDIAKSMPENDQFVRVINNKDMITGLIRLKPHQKDHQTPHPRDEVYLLLSGDGYLQIDDKSFKLEKNSLYFVPKETKHNFYGNNEELVILYFFGGGVHFPITFEL